MKKFLEQISMILWYPIGIVCCVLAYLVVVVVCFLKWLKNRVK